MLENIFGVPPSKIFLQTNDSSYTYQWLQQRIRKIAGLFESLNLKKGDHLLLAVSDEPEMSALFLSALINGIVTIIADPDSKAPRARAIMLILI